MRLQAPRPAQALRGSSQGRRGRQQPLALAETKAEQLGPSGPRVGGEGVSSLKGVGLVQEAHGHGAGQMVILRKTWAQPTACNLGLGAYCLLLLAQPLTHTQLCLKQLSSSQDPCSSL